MNGTEHKALVTSMHTRERLSWNPESKKTHINKRLLRNSFIFAAVSLCAGTGVWLTMRNPARTQAVMSHFTAEFEYDDSLGRLQLVSCMLPESAQVFFSDEQDLPVLSVPAGKQIMHDWSLDEPWLEYSHTGEVNACMGGEVITVIKNRGDEYTVRLLHEHGYESVYSGLSSVCIKENTSVFAGEALGTSADTTAFELRKDGLSILPVFDEADL